MRFAAQETTRLSESTMARKTISPTPMNWQPSTTGSVAVVGSHAQMFASAPKTSCPSDAAATLTMPGFHTESVMNDADWRQ